MKLPHIIIRFPVKKTKCPNCGQSYSKKHTCQRLRKYPTPIYHDNCPATSDGKRSIRIDLDGICFRCNEFFPEVKRRYDEMMITKIIKCEDSLK